MAQPPAAAPGLLCKPTQGEALWVAKPRQPRAGPHISRGGVFHTLAPFLLTNAKGCGHCRRDAEEAAVAGGWKSWMAARLGNPLLQEGVYQSSLTRLMEKAVTCQSSGTGYRPQGISCCSSSPDCCLPDLGQRKEHTLYLAGCKAPPALPKSLFKQEWKVAAVCCRKFYSV